MTNITGKISDDTEATTLEEADFAGIQGGANKKFPGELIQPRDATLGSQTEWVVDEDDMASDSAVKVPTQQSVNAAKLQRSASRIAMAALDLDIHPKVDFDGHTWETVADASGDLLGSSITSTAIDASTETITSADHGLRTGMAVVATSAVNGVSTNTLYYVIGQTTAAIAYTDITSAFTVGQTLTDGTATATITKIIDKGSNTGLIWLSGVSGTFTQDVTITDGAGGSATAAEANTTYPDTDNFKIASSFTDAQAGTAFNLTGTSAMTLKRHYDPEQGMFVTPTSDITGASGAWKRKGWLVGVNASWFGFDSSNSAADNQKALQAAAYYSGNVWVPNADYAMTGKIRGYGGLSIMGVPGGKSRLVWDNGSTAGFDIVLTTDYTRQVVFDNLDITTARDGTTTNVIYVDGRAQIRDGAIFRRFFPRGYIKNCRFAGSTGPSTNGWFSGIDLLSCCRMQIDQNAFIGKFTTNESPTNLVSEFMVRIRGLGHPAEIDIRQNYAVYTNKAVTLNGEAEGIDISGKNRFLACNYGVFGTVDIYSVRSEVSIIGNHMNCLIWCVNLSNYNDSVIANNNFLQRSTSTSAAGAVVLTDCNDTSVHSNTITAQFTATSVDYRGVLLSGDTNNCTVYGNTGLDMSVVVWGQGSTYDNTAWGNALRLQARTSAALYTDTSGNNSFEHKYHSAENGSAVTAGSSGALCTVDLGTVYVGQKFHVSAAAQFLKNTTRGPTSLFVNKSSGTGAFIANHDATELRHRINQEVSDTDQPQFSGVIRVTTAGTLVLALNYASSVGTVDVSSGAAQIAVVDLGDSIKQ